MAYQLEKFGYAVLSGNTSLQEIVIPPSISQISQIDSHAFLGSSLTSIIFLGMSSYLSAKIQISEMFGIGHDCEFTTSDAKRFKWLASSKTVTEVKDYKQLGSAKVSAGKPNKLKLGGKFYFFTEQLYSWCTNPENQDISKFPNPVECPLVIVYGDFKTSLRSRQFLKNILEDSSYYRWAKENLKCFMFLLDRDGMIDKSSYSSDLRFFKTLQPEGSCKDFIVVQFIYKTRSITKTFLGKTWSSFRDMLLEGCDQAGFSSFDPTQYENALDEVDPEEVPMTGLDQNSIENYSKSLPWWYSGGKLAVGAPWTLASSKPFDYIDISTPETTYILFGAYDERNPNSYPTKIHTALAPEFKKYCNAENFYETYNSECYNGKFMELFAVGCKYRFFQFFEFSHGANDLISIDKDHSTIKKRMYDAMRTGGQNKVFGQFDSCDSGSMIDKFAASSSVSTIFSTSNPGIAIGDYLAKKFDRRAHLLKSLFGIDASTVTPKWIFWASTERGHYGWYHPTESTLYQEGENQALALKKDNDRYDAVFELVKEHAWVNKGDGTADESIPQKRVYPDDNHYEKCISFY